jgi:uncharacterized cupredoxin-like copper-binding protein
VALLLALTAACGTSAPEITITMKDFRYQPDTVVVPNGQKVVLKVVNADDTEHDFSTSAPLQVGHQSGGMSHMDMNMDMSGQKVTLHLHTPAKGTATAEITASQRGTFEIHCSVQGHQDAGMVAKLVVQ